MTEVTFWTERAANLNSIHQQLSDAKIQKVVQILDLAKSTYHPAFERLYAEVQGARQEANSNVKFLKPLKKYLEKLNQLDEFPALVDLFKPIVHTLLLIWRYSDHYNKAARFVTLMVEICNDLIMQVRLRSRRGGANRVWGSVSVDAQSKTDLRARPGGGYASSSLKVGIQGLGLGHCLHGGANN